MGRYVFAMQLLLNTSVYCLYKHVLNVHCEMLNMKGGRELRLIYIVPYCCDLQVEASSQIHHPYMHSFYVMLITMQRCYGS